MTALIGLGWFAAFLRALAPSVGAEDAGEFAAAAWSLGVGHAPGYPLHALTGRLAMVIPVGDPAFRLNLLSAVSAAGACAALFHLVRRESGERFGAGRVSALAGGLAASAAFGLGRALWHQATISDKYAFHLLAHAGICLAAVRGLRPAAVALLAGVAFSHHLQTLYLMPGLGWWLWIRRPSPRMCGVLAVCFIAGLGPKLLYPPVRGVSEPALQLARPSTLGRQLAYLRAGAYADRIAGPVAEARWRDAWHRLASETAVGGLVTGLAGVAIWSRRAGAVAPIAALTILTGLGVTASLELTGREFYLLPVLWWLAAGSGWLLATGLATPRRAARLAAVVAVAAVGAIGFANRGWYDRSRMTLERDFGINLLAGLPPHAVLFASGDDVLYPLFHHLIVHGARPDVVVIPEGFLSWAPARARIAAAIPESVRVLAAPPGTASEEGWSRAVAAGCVAANRSMALTNPSRAGIATGLRLEVRDLVWEIFAKRPVMPERPARWMIVRGWHHPAAALTERQQWLIGLYGKYQRQCADRLANAGDAASALPRFRRALANPYLPDRPGAANNYALALERTGDRTGALPVYRKALTDPTAGAEVWINAGNLLQGLGRPAEAKTMFEGGLQRAPSGSVHAAYAAAKLTALR